MRRDTMLPILMLAVALATATVAQQTNGPMTPEQRFKQLDRDGDGKLTPQELPGEWFGRLDTNKDGVVTLEEAKAALAGGAAQRTGQGQQPQGAAVPSRLSALGEWAGVFDLCVRDVPAAARFYCDGIGMKRVTQPDPQNATLLEWQGTYLRRRQVQAAFWTRCDGSTWSRTRSSSS